MIANIDIVTLFDWKYPPTHVEIPSYSPSYPSKRKLSGYGEEKDMSMKTL